MPKKSLSEKSASGFSRVRKLLARGIPAVLVLSLSGESPRASGEPLAEKHRSHWAFQPVLRSPPPPVKNGCWARNPIDLFILAKLEQHNLNPSPEADRTTLLRRLQFNLTGLPPSPVELARFLENSHPFAYEQKVEQLLASPHYGERWARHWLDVVRFAESTGFETNLERKNAWPYRDYVIAAFNENKPYDQFIHAQLAGDSLGADAATGFLVAGPYDVVKSPDPNLTAQQRRDELHDIIHTTGSTFLGLTVGCARCHDHKFDPVSQLDYYAMQALLSGVRHGERPLPPPDHQKQLQLAESQRQRLTELLLELESLEPLANPSFTPNSSGNPPAHEPLRPPVHPRKNIENLSPIPARFVRFTILSTTGSEPCIDELEVYSANPPLNIALASAGTRAAASGTYPNSELHKLEHLNDGRTGNSRSWISHEPGQGWVQLEFPQTILINKIIWSRDREGKFKDRLATEYRIEAATDPDHWTLIAASNDRAKYSPDAAAKFSHRTTGLSEDKVQRLEVLLEEKEELEREIEKATAVPAVYAGVFEQPGPTHLLYRGEPLQKREQAPPAALRSIGGHLELPEETPEQQRRLALARWITDPSHPLTARVMVNRVWQSHFGEGLVHTPGDFGLNGAPPSHPELLDWLAAEFIEQRWNIKAMQRLILLSSTFRQSSQARSEAAALDASSRWLWRFPPRRLEAEPIRDAILQVSGQLVLTMGGRGFDLFEPNDNYVKVYEPKKEFGPAEWRRMIYQNKPRMELDDTFGAFDCPDAGQIAPKRNHSTTALQALNLLNSPFLIEQSKLFADRLRIEAGDNLDRQVALAFHLAFSRHPSPEELRKSKELIEEHGLMIFCRAIYNANEFVYLF